MSSPAGSVTAQPAAPPGPPLLVSTKRRIGDRAFRIAALACGLLVLVILVGIVGATLNKSWAAIQYEGISFITSKTWDPANGKLGGLSLIYGTISPRSSPWWSPCRSAWGSPCS